MTTRLEKPRRSCRYDAGITIDNSPIRDIDWTRHRALWRRFLALLVLMGIGMAATWQHGELRRYGYDMERLRQERSTLEATNRQLWLEIEMLRSPARIERPTPGPMALLMAGPARPTDANAGAALPQASPTSGTEH